MSSKPVFFIMAAVVCIVAILIALPIARAQNASARPTVDLSGEPGNWGLTPFSAVPPIALRPADRAAIRALEDQQIKERAEEREALRAQLSATR